MRCTYEDVSQLDLSANAANLGSALATAEVPSNLEQLANVLTVLFYRPHLRTEEFQHERQQCSEFLLSRYRIQRTCLRPGLNDVQDPRAAS